MVLRRPRKPKVEKPVAAPAVSGVAPRPAPSPSMSHEETSAEDLVREIAEIKQKVHADPELLARWIRQQLRQSDDSAHLPGDMPPEGLIVPRTLH